ncbi:MAG: 3-dehydroquinate synthase, partial [Cyclobacteriaceae bacterium]
GGGVIGDMGGFCAATYKRGIDFINLPTTLLSQVDASVGGKLGIDFQGFKNHIGLFQNPKKVIIFPGFLESLPENELKSGYAEVIKHCLIADADYWDKLIEVDWDQQPWQAIIEHSVDVKTTITKQDPQENGLRKILNFGHTIGHAAESFFLESHHPILHGEAVALGMIAETYLSTKQSGLSTEEQNQIVNYISSIYKKIDLDEESIDRISELIRQDKKNEADQIKASLLEKIGKAAYDITITTAEVKEALHFYQNATEH